MSRSAHQQTRFYYHKHGQPCCGNKELQSLSELQYVSPLLMMLMILIVFHSHCLLGRSPAMLNQCVSERRLVLQERTTKCLHLCTWIHRVALWNRYREPQSQVCSFNKPSWPFLTGGCIIMLVCVACLKILMSASLTRVWMEPLAWMGSTPSPVSASRATKESSVNKVRKHN